MGKIVRNPQEGIQAKINTTSSEATPYQNKLSSLPRNVDVSTYS